MTNDYRYPLSEHEADRLKAASERPLNDITFEKAVAGELQPDDLRIHAETLRAQAEIARQAGHPQLAANLLRAAELTVVPSDELLKIYDLLRPGRASLETLHALAARLEQQYQAAETARFVREAADVYAARGLLRRKA
jgi:propanediol dehydratase small subunit